MTRPARALRRRVSRALAATVIAGALLASPRAARAQCPVLPGDAFAFLPVNPPTDHCRPDPIVRWAAAQVVYDCSFFADGQHGVDCGGDAQSCVDSCNAAAGAWNADLAGHFAFIPATAPITFCTAGTSATDGRTSIGGSATVCDGSAFGSHVIAVTLRQTRVGGSHEGELLDSDITVNNQIAFPPALFHGTVGHELGHVLGLDHPDQCGHDAIVLMRSVFILAPTDPCFVSEPTADDITGGLMIYAGANSTPTPATTPAPVCGDADGNGAVTVSDGVQTLRAAAGLPSTCTLARCDVDNSGAVTVSDGVGVLRDAAGLSFANACAF